MDRISLLSGDVTSKGAGNVLTTSSEHGNMVDSVLSIAPSDRACDASPLLGKAVFGIPVGGSVKNSVFDSIRCVVVGAAVVDVVVLVVDVVVDVVVVALVVVDVFSALTNGNETFVGIDTCCVGMAYWVGTLSVSSLETVFFVLIDSALNLVNPASGGECDRDRFFSANALKMPSMK